MAEKQYHAFWTENVSHGIKRRSTCDDQEIVALRKSADGEYPSVRELTVIYGVVVEFEPVKIVDSYKIKD